MSFLLFDAQQQTSPFPVNILCHFYKDDDDVSRNVYEINNDLFSGDLTYDATSVDVGVPPLSVTYGLDGTSPVGLDRFKTRYNLQRLSPVEIRRVKRQVYYYHAHVGVQTRAEMNFCLMNP